MASTRRFHGATLLILRQRQYPSVSAQDTFETCHILYLALRPGRDLPASLLQLGRILPTRPISQQCLSVQATRRETTHIVESLPALPSQLALIHKLLQHCTLLHELLGNLAALGLFPPSFTDEARGVCNRARSAASPQHPALSGWLAHQVRQSRAA